jgi:hypothetical protein
MQLGLEVVDVALGSNQLILNMLQSDAGVIEVITPSRGKPSHHGRVSGVSRNVHIDLTTPSLN